MHWFKGFAGCLGLIAMACGSSSTTQQALATGGANASGAGDSSDGAGRDSNSSAGDPQPGGAGDNSNNGKGGNGSGGGGSGNAAAGAGAGAPPVSYACDNPTFTCKATGTLPSTAPDLTTATWVNISPKDVPYGQDMAFTQGMAIDWCDPATMYITANGYDQAADHAGIYKTTDGGSTWKKMGQLDEPIKVRIDPKNPQHLYVVDGVRGATMGFWVSCDGGETFYQPDGFKALHDNPGITQNDTYDCAVDPADFNHVLVTHHSAWGWTDTKYNASSGVLESKDGGNTWITHDPQDGWGSGHAINFLINPVTKAGDANTWLLGTQGPGMFKTKDAGKTWTKVSDLGIQHGGGSVYYDKTGVLWASGAAENLRSTDNGDTWTKVGNAKGYNAVFGDGTLLYTAPVFGPTTFFTSPEGGDGTTWTALGTQELKGGPFELAVDRKNGVLYTANWVDGLWAHKL